MIHPSIWNHVGTKEVAGDKTFNGKQSNPEQWAALLAEKNPTPPTEEPATEPTRTLSPLQTYTRLNSHNIPLSETKTTPPLQEWLSTLKPEVRDLISANMDETWQKHLEGLDTNGRVELVAVAEETLVFLREMSTL